MRRDTGGAGMMILSAMIFGYFGFMTAWNHHSVVTGEFLLFVALLDWTLKISAVVFVLSAILAMVSGPVGNLVYGVCSLIGAVLFIVIAVMDYADTQHQAISPFLLLVFGLWNGYAAVSSLRSMSASRGDPE